MVKFEDESEKYSYFGYRCKLLGGSALVLVNEVTLHRARLVLGWVTVFERANHLGL